MKCLYFFCAVVLAASGLVWLADFVFIYNKQKITFNKYHSSIV
jgi:hypothetical protein